MATKTQRNVAVRWLIRRDMPAVLAIENQCFEFPWSEDDFLNSLRQRNCIGMVAMIGGKIVGFMIYELHKSKLNLLSLAVCRELQRQGIGTQMIGRLIGKLSSQRRNAITLVVRETNLAAQLFLSNSGFRAVSLCRNHYDDTDEDAYLMRYQLEEMGSQSTHAKHRNRIAAFDAS